MGIDCIGYGATVIANDKRICDCTAFGLNKPYTVAWDGRNNRCGIDCSAYNASIISTDPTKCKLKLDSSFTIAWDSKINNKMGIDCVGYGG
jgi:hypothetical protein